MAIPSAPATSPAMAAGRGSPNSMPAGLSALLKPDAASRGKPAESMEKLFNVAKDLPDSVLADVLAGRSLQVPQYLAMLVATGRKNLRTAMQGVQARAQMQQPSVKDKLMAEETVSPMMGQPMPGQMPVMAAEGGLMYADGGIASLPAPNMDTVDMADGGIIAFQDRGLVPSFAQNALAMPKGDLPIEREESKEERIMREYRERIAAEEARGPKPYERFKNYLGKAKEEATERAAGYSTPRISALTAPAPNARLSTAQDILNFTGEGTAPATSLVPAPAPAPAPARVLGAAPAAAGPAPADSGMGSLKSYMDAIKANQEDYYKKLEGFGAKEREGLAQLRRQGGGEALMNIAQGILSKPTLSQGISAGLPGVIQSAAASRKDQREVNALANSYDMNLAKARAADARGNTEAALKFMNLADEAKYRAGDLQYKMASLNKDPEAVRYLRALAKPGESLSDTFARVEGVKGKTNLYSIDKATDDFNKIMENPVGSEAKKLKAAGITTPFAYQQYVLNQGSGGGFDLSAAAKAELERRNKQ